MRNKFNYSILLSLFLIIAAIGLIYPHQVGSEEYFKRVKDGFKTIADTVVDVVVAVVNAVMNVTNSLINIAISTTEIVIGRYLALIR